MDFSLSEEQIDLRDLARKILGDACTNDHLKDVEAEEPVFDRALWRELGKANLLGICVPEAQGGSSYGFFELCVLLQEIGRAVAPLPAYAGLALGALPLAAFGSAEQKQRWLPDVASGETILSAALLELDSDDPLDPGTRAKADGNGFRLEGEKSSIPAGPLADRILVPARTEDGRIALFWVDPRGDGAQLTPQTSADKQPHALLTLSGAPVAPGDLLGDLDRGAEMLAWLVRRATVALCAVQLGVLERALEMTAAYGREREQFDRPIGSFQAFHQRAADAYINIEAVRLATWEAAFKLAEGEESDSSVEIAKYWASEGGQSVAYACQHLHGGIGIDLDYPLHRYFVWAIEIEHTLGSARAQLASLGRRIAAEVAADTAA